MTYALPLIESVQYPGFRPPNWYARVTWPDGRTSHSEPWKTQTAADYLVAATYRKLGLMSRRDGNTGDGDSCPLFPDHGPMLVIKGSNPPKQYCPDAIHDGRKGKDGVPSSRQFWPLYGFEEAVASYMARLDRAIRESGLPDLSDLEVK